MERKKKRTARFPGPSLLLRRVSTLPESRYQAAGRGKRPVKRLVSNQAVFGFSRYLCITYPRSLGAVFFRKITPATSRTAVGASPYYSIAEAMSRRGTDAAMARKVSLNERALPPRGKGLFLGHHDSRAHILPPLHIDNYNPSQLHRPARRKDLLLRCRRNACPLESCQLSQGPP